MSEPIPNWEEQNAKYLFRSGVVLFGREKVGSEIPVFCSHSHLYSYKYVKVSPVNDADYEHQHLQVTGWSMSGLPGEGTCEYSRWVALNFEIYEGAEMATQAD